MFIIKEITIPTDHVNLLQMSSDQIIHWMQSTVFPCVVAKGEVWTSSPVVIKGSQWITAPVVLRKYNYLTGESERDQNTKEPRDMKEFLTKYEGCELNIPHIEKGKGFIGWWFFNIAVNEQGAVELLDGQYRRD